MEIRPYPKNAKKHTQRQIEQVANSIREFGMNQPIVVDKEGVIIVGHGRYEALKFLNREITDDMIKVIDLPEDKATAYRLADNKLNESEWDMLLVLPELKSLPDDLLLLTGFDKDLIMTPEVPEDIDGVASDNYPKLTIMFQNFEDMELARVEVNELLKRYEGSYVSYVGGGEL